MRWLAVVLVAIATLTACGTDRPEADPSAGGGSASRGTDLVVTVVTDEGVEPKTMSLSCDPAGGDHPNGEAACARLEAVEGSVFEPVPAGRACTEIYGGPQVATIAGVVDGTEVDASFDRSDGCEIDRWDSLGTEVFDVPML